MTIHIVLNVVKLLIFFPTKGVVSDTLSPKTIMSGETVDYKKHLSIQLGQYCQVHEEDNPRNSQIARTQGAISLGPFTDRHGRLIGDVEIPGVDDQDENDDHLPGVVPVITYDIEITGVDVTGTENQDAVPAPQVEIDDLDIHHADPSPIEVAPTQEEPITETPAPVALTKQAPELRISTIVRSQTNQGYTPSLSGSKYSYAVTKLESQGVLNPDSRMFVQDDFYQSEPDVVAAIMTQLSLKAGLKEWG
jgi:hypothetical protein